MPKNEIEQVTANAMTISMSKDLSPLRVLELEFTSPIMSLIYFTCFRGLMALD
jgi:hypothetical protein